MFKAKFEDINMNSQPLKASVAKTLRSKLLEAYPNMEEFIDEIWPKKAKVQTLKFKGENQYGFIKIEEDILFIEMRDRAILPMLRLLHKYPSIMDHMICDKGAIKHIMSGSNVMAPGLTSENGVIHPGLETGSPVAIMAEGMKHAMGIGYLQMSSDDIKNINKG